MLRLAALTHVRQLSNRLKRKNALTLKMPFDPEAKLKIHLTLSLSVAEL